MLRVLLCFDFAYGFPRDFSAALQTATGKADAALPWLATWQYLGEAIKDDVGTVLHRKPTNRSNRFDVANTINSLLSLSPEAPGPFLVRFSSSNVFVYSSESASPAFPNRPGIFDPTSAVHRSARAKWYTLSTFWNCQRR